MGHIDGPKGHKRSMNSHLICPSHRADYLTTQKDRKGEMQKGMWERERMRPPSLPCENLPQLRSYLRMTECY